MDAVTQDDFERFTQDNAGEPNTNTHSSNQYADAIQALIAQNEKMLEMLQISQQNQQQTVRVNSNQDIKNLNIMPDLSKTIDKFAGEMGPAVATTWLQQIESTSLLHSWPDAFTYETARSNLESAAKYWLSG
ncbi:hypothetical protein QE152_g22837 [Popillia japonica]|uniref:Uncharacterized protein n=1 Tax=Popillia japonica TaxID=7064 RepID=A0AAW1KJJ2_POPJA